MRRGPEDADSASHGVLVQGHRLAATGGAPEGERAKEPLEPTTREGQS